MKVRPLSRDEVRSIDVRAANELGLSTLVLMENAGRGAAEWLRGQGVGEGARVRLVCGPGNNGGDGGVVARHLDAWGVDVRVGWLADLDRLRGDAAAQHAILEKSWVFQEAWSPSDEALAGRVEAFVADADWVVDGLFGTGLARPVEGGYARAIDAMNGSGKPILALDLPSGLDADTGEPLGVAVRATATATFVAPKRGFAVPGANVYTGTVTVVEIGVPRIVLESFGGSESIGKPER